MDRPWHINPLPYLPLPNQFTSLSLDSPPDQSTRDIHGRPPDGLSLSDHTEPLSRCDSTQNERSVMDITGMFREFEIELSLPMENCRGAGSDESLRTICKLAKQELMIQLCWFFWSHGFKAFSAVIRCKNKLDWMFTALYVSPNLSSRIELWDYLAGVARGLPLLGW
ncbi:hypothetical protein ACSBR1_039765 [Camellia fascicularis]